jgi:transcriptional regulator with XRE-family HTH domain
MEIGARLRKMRDAYRYSIVGMANQLSVHRETYGKNEMGISVPGAISLYNLGNLFNISLDWLVCNKGPMYFTEKTGEQKAADAAAGSPPLSDEIKELVDYMGKIPLLRYEILSQFHRFREEHQAMVEKAIK